MLVLAWLFSTKRKNGIQQSSSKGHLSSIFVDSLANFFAHFSSMMILQANLETSVPSPLVDTYGSQSLKLQLNCIMPKLAPTVARYHKFKNHTWAYMPGRWQTISSMLSIWLIFFWIQNTMAVLNKILRQIWNNKPFFNPSGPPYTEFGGPKTEYPNLGWKARQKSLAAATVTFPLAASVKIPSWHQQRKVF